MCLLGALESKRRLAILRKDVARIVKHMTKTPIYYLSAGEARLLENRFKAKNVFEFEPGIWNGYDAYVKYKEKIYIPRLLYNVCWDIEDRECVVQIVHALAHIADLGIGHGDGFWHIRNRMMKAIESMPKPMSLCVARRIFAARCIQRRWKECISNPEYTVCRQRLLREWSEQVDQNSI
jgi:hypothetical protein